ncbi:MAG TPA: hypothetical protein VF701_12640 [Thermoanaerobaculia bacterium]
MTYILGAATDERDESVDLVHAAIATSRQACERHQTGAVNPWPAPPKGSFLCVRCGATAPFSPGGWAFVYSQVLTHIWTCSPDEPPRQQAELASLTVDLLAE